MSGPERIHLAHGFPGVEHDGMEWGIPPSTRKGDPLYIRADICDEAVKALREALKPFADAWDVALHQAGDHPGSLRTLGPLGALAAHQITGIHFQRARAALAKIGEAG